MLAAFTERLDAAIGRRAGRWLAVLSAIFLAVSIVRAGTTPFLPDEVVTVWASALPSHAGLRAALADGLDSQPPLYPVALRVLQSPVGEGWFITRLPAIAGFWIAAVTVFVLVRRRASALLALTAALLLFFTAADRHAIEARGAVPAMASVAVSFYAWTEAAAGRRPFLHSVLLATSLSAAVWWDYLAALAFLPLGVGEFVRWRTARWRDVRWRAEQPSQWPIRTALTVSAAAALPLVPLAGPALAAREPASAGPTAMMTGTYAELLAPLGGWLLVIGWLIPILMAIASVAMVLANRDVDLEPRALAPHEAAAGAAFALLPAIAALLGGVLDISITARDVLIAVPPLAAGFAVLVHRLTPRSGVADAVLLGSVAMSFAILVVTTFLPARLSFAHPVESRPALVRALENTNEPVVLAGGDLVLPIAYYAGLKWPDRTVILAGPDLAREAGQATTADRQRVAIAKWTAVAIEPFYPYTAITRSFFVYEAGSDWLVPKLRELNASVEPSAREPGGTLYRVRLRGPLP